MKWWLRSRIIMQFIYLWIHGKMLHLERDFLEFCKYILDFQTGFRFVYQNSWNILLYLLRVTVWWSWLQAAALIYTSYQQRHLRHSIFNNVLKGVNNYLYFLSKKVTPMVSFEFNFHCDSCIGGWIKLVYIICVVWIKSTKVVKGKLL